VSRSDQAVSRSDQAVSRDCPGRRTTLITAAFGFGLARATYALLTRRPPGGAGRWTRTNHRDQDVTLLEGPAAAVAVAATALLAPGVPRRLRTAGALAALGAGGFGLLDDLGERGSSKGLRGHLGALGRGELTTGGVKMLGIGLTGLVAAALCRADRRVTTAQHSGGRAADLAISGVLIAGTANLLNLFDLRPGRALKVALLAAPAVLGNGPASGPAAGLVAAALGPAASMLGEDLAEHAMLGDAGANALGAVLGTALVAGARRRTRLAVLGGVIGLTLASEKVSFTRVIAATPGLRELDALGRRPVLQ
jgi:UDP-GlcNAc:undecaprenyl-phosphate GlcNAc-1-phosphate transferase